MAPREVDRRSRDLSYRPRARRGLTLVEVLIALAVMMVFVLPVVIGLSQALSVTSQSSTAVVASSTARQTIENLKAVGYANIQSSATRSTADLRPGDHYFEIETVVVEEQPNTAKLDGLKRVEVSVYQAGSQTPLVVLFTYFTPVGV
jgi:prepilin-type N-terminal cleavage/methylation domain-containing protein